MSKIKNNPLLKGASGMLGDVVVYREVRGKIIMCNRPRKPDVPTAHQKEMSSRFLRAVMYARKQLGIPEAKLEYATGITDRKHSAYVVALSDYMTAPTINSVDHSKYRGLIGDILTIRATDDFKVVDVSVIIRNALGEVIENGTATLLPDSFDEWRYSVTFSNPALPGTIITVTAVDKPGNATVAEYTL